MVLKFQVTFLQSFLTKNLGDMQLGLWFLRILAIDLGFLKKWELYISRIISNHEDVKCQDT